MSYLTQVHNEIDREDSLADIKEKFYLDTVYTLKTEGKVTYEKSSGLGKTVSVIVTVKEIIEEVSEELDIYSEKLYLSSNPFKVDPVKRSEALEEWLVRVDQAIKAIVTGKLLL